MNAIIRLYLIINNLSNENWKIIILYKREVILEFELISYFFHLLNLFLSSILCID